MGTYGNKARKIIFKKINHRTRLPASSVPVALAPTVVADDSVSHPRLDR